MKTINDTFLYDFSSKVVCLSKPSYQIRLESCLNMLIIKVYFVMWSNNNLKLKISLKFESTIQHTPKLNSTLGTQRKKNSNFSTLAEMFYLTCESWDINNVKSVFNFWIQLFPLKALEKADSGSLILKARTTSKKNQVKSKAMRS